MRPDPFAGEAPLFTITAANYQRYADKLPEGQKALFAKYPDYRMAVYPTHRSAALPAWVYANIAANATRAHAAPDGIRFGVEGAAGGIPFPIPKNGTEAVWNHLLAFWGPAREDRIENYFVAADGSRRKTNDYLEIVDFPYYYPQATPDSFGSYYFKRREISSAPAELAGRGYLLWQPDNVSRRTICRPGNICRANGGCESRRCCPTTRLRRMAAGSKASTTITSSAAAPTAMISS